MPAAPAPAHQTRCPKKKPLRGRAVFKMCLVETKAMCTEVLLESMKMVLSFMCPEPQREAVRGQPATQCPRPKQRPVWAATRERWIKA